MSAIVDFNGLGRTIMDDHLDMAALYCCDASALLTVFQSGIESLTVSDAEKITMVDAVVSLLDDARSCLKSVTAIDLKSVFARIDQVTVVLNCLRRSFNREADCPNNEIQVGAVHALGHLLERAQACLNDVAKAA